MDLVYADEAKKDIGFLEPYSFDMAYGSDENDFECIVDINDHCLDKGFYIYSPYNEIGGIVDGIKVSSEKEQITYFGRSWHGVLENKIFSPPANNDYLYLSGEANSVLSYIVALFDLGDLFSVPETDSGIIIKRYQMERYIGGYSGIIKMLKENGAKLRLKWEKGMIQMQAVPLIDYTAVDEIDSSQRNITVTQNYKACNHLICLGKGDLAQRAVIHLFTDEKGNIQPYSKSAAPIKDSDYILDESQKVLFNENEIVKTYDYSSAEITTNYVLTTTRPSDWNSNYKNYYTYDGESYKAVSDTSAPSWKANTYYSTVQDRYAVLVKNGKDKLKEYWSKNKCDFKFSDNDSEYDINDIVGASESITGVKVKNNISKKIVKIKQNETTIEYEVK